MKVMYEKAPSKGWICRPTGNLYKNQPFCCGWGITRSVARKALREWLKRNVDKCVCSNDLMIPSGAHHKHCLERGEQADGQ